MPNKIIAEKILDQLGKYVDECTRKYTPTRLILDEANYENIQLEQALGGREHGLLAVGDYRNAL